MAAFASWTRRLRLGPSRPPRPSKLYPASVARHARPLAVAAALRPSRPAAACDLLGHANHHADDYNGAGPAGFSGRVSARWCWPPGNRGPVGYGPRRESRRGPAAGGPAGTGRRAVPGPGCTVRGGQPEQRGGCVDGWFASAGPPTSRMWSVTALRRFSVRPRWPRCSPATRMPPPAGPPAH
jgi:hypothetical protein